MQYAEHFIIRHLNRHMSIELEETSRQTCVSAQSTKQVMHIKRHANVNQMQAYLFSVGLAEKHVG